jgi:AcrR family transcriptional regulator
VVPPALQARSRLTHSKILAAGTQLLADGGLEALTISAVAELAGVAVGSVYRRFGDKERLLAAIQIEFTTGVRPDFEDRMSRAGLPGSASATEIVAAVVRGLADTFEQHERLLRVFLLLSADDDAIRAVGLQVGIEMGQAFAELVSHRRADIRRPDPDAAIDYAYRLVYAMCTHRVVHRGVESDRPLSWAQLTDELITAVTLYLFAAPV